MSNLVRRGLPVKRLKIQYEDFRRAMRRPYCDLCDYEYAYPKHPSDRLPTEHLSDLPNTHLQNLPTTYRYMQRKVYTKRRYLFQTRQPSAGPIASERLAKANRVFQEGWEKFKRETEKERCDEMGCIMGRGHKH